MDNILILHLELVLPALLDAQNAVLQLFALNLLMAIIYINQKLINAKNIAQLVLLKLIVKLVKMDMFMLNQQNLAPKILAVQANTLITQIINVQIVDLIARVVILEQIAKLAMMATI